MEDGVDLPTGLLGKREPDVWVVKDQASGKVKREEHGERRKVSEKPLQRSKNRTGRKGRVKIISVITFFQNKKINICTQVKCTLS